MERTLQKRIPVGADSWVSVDVYGDPEAPGLVMVPGVMTDAHEWRHVARAMTAWRSVSVVNRRGRSPSGPLTDAYSMRLEIEDLAGVLKELGQPETLFGWSYGGLIALLLATDQPMKRVIAYEPVVPPFGNEALPGLQVAAESGDWDRSVEIVNREISGFAAAQVRELRADRSAWATLRRLSQPLHAELRALSEARVPDVIAEHAEHVDLIIGARNRGLAPYGTTFEDVRARVPHAAVHPLVDQGHLAHAQAPAALGRLLDSLAAA